MDTFWSLLSQLPVVEGLQDNLEKLEASRGGLEMPELEDCFYLFILTEFWAGRVMWSQQGFSISPGAKYDKQVKIEKRWTVKKNMTRTSKDQSSWKRRHHGWPYNDTPRVTYMETMSQKRKERVGRAVMKMESIIILVRSIRVKGRSIGYGTGSRQVVLFSPIG